ncbi:MAG: hypothetical protein MZU91_06295 [Desulfosudis oleivorans]|nr:hypothetical protein [Desulfosudis oleivorans]
MDDAKAVRDVTGAMLSHIGYDVEFARDGREAIALYREAKQSDEPFDAVILDLYGAGWYGWKGGYPASSRNRSSHKGNYIQRVFW